MTKQEKVIDILEACSTNCCIYCPLNSDKCYSNFVEVPEEALMDALTLLKEQEARVLTLEKLHDNTIETVYYESIQGTLLECKKEWSVISDNFIYLIDGYNENILRNCNTYGILWRCWISKPSEQQRKDTPWNDYMSWEE